MPSLVADRIVERSRRRPTPQSVRVLSIDPGRDKCGLAIVDSEQGVLARGVIPTALTADQARAWVKLHQPDRILCGAGTGAGAIRKALTNLGLPVESCPESHTTQRARQRYFQEHPPRGLRRLLPLGLQTPPIPVDDYAAILIAEDYLAQVEN